MRILIVDDAPSDRARLKSLLEPEPDVEIVGECPDGRSAVDAILSLAPDLVFLDVEMPEMDGFEVVRAVGPERFPLLVFATAYDRYAVEAFDLPAADYLLKPYTEERFRRALDRARETLHKRELERLNDGLSDLIGRFRNGNGHLRRLAVRLEGRVRFLDVEEIDWIEADAKFVRIHSGRAVYPLREAIGRLEEKLDPARFLRVHRSAIVNVERVAEIEDSANGRQAVVLRNGERIPLSRGNRLKLYDVVVEEPAPRTR